MPGAVFSAGGGITPLTFSVNPCYPGKVALCSGVVRAATEGGDDYVYEKGPGYVLYLLKFEGMPASDFDGEYDYTTHVQAQGTESLVNWFFNIAGPLSPEFTYQDPFGTAHLVSIVDDRLDFSLTDHGLYSGVLTLKERLG